MSYSALDSLSSSISSAPPLLSNTCTNAFVLCTWSQTVISAVWVCTQRNIATAEQQCAHRCTNHLCAFLFVQADGVHHVRRSSAWLYCVLVVLRAAAWHNGYWGWCHSFVSCLQIWTCVRAHKCVGHLRCAGADVGFCLFRRLYFSKSPIGKPNHHQPDVL